MSKNAASTESVEDEVELIEKDTTEDIKISLPIDFIENETYGPVDKMLEKTFQQDLQLLTFGKWCFQIRPTLYTIGSNMIRDLFTCCGRISALDLVLNWIAWTRWFH